MYAEIAAHTAGKIAFHRLLVIDVKENQNVPKTMAPESSGGKVLIPIFSVAAVVLAAVLIFSGLFGRTPVSDLTSRFQFCRSI